LVADGIVVPGALALRRHDHDLAGLAHAFDFGRLDLGRFSLRRFALCFAHSGSFHGTVLIGRNFWRFDFHRFFHRALLRRVRHGIRCMGYVRPGIDGIAAGFTAGLVALLLAHGCNSPLKVDYLVTFIACQIVTGCHGYGNFRIDPVRDLIRRRQVWNRFAPAIWPRCRPRYRVALITIVGEAGFPD
jgi:hypothetical protein